MRNKKLLITFFMVVMLCISSLLLLAGCGEKASELLVSSKEAPRSTYVLGQELDLSTGKLTYIYDGEESELPLTAEGVSISGYNKDQLGEQTLTVSYMEKTAEFKVNVIPRIKAENFETKYFIEDSFDKSKGKLTVARDDGTTFSVNMNNEKVSLVSFDSKSAGEKEVKVKYSTETAEYECSFNVNVYAIASVTLKTPDKIAYQSHDTELDYSGGYLTVKSTDESLSKFVQLSDGDVIISGFDISAATIEHRDTPLVQEITISYGGYEFKYNISIKYSGVSIIRDKAKLLQDIDWESEDATVSKEQGEAAIEAINEYYDLPKSSRTLLSKSTMDNVVRALAIYVNIDYRSELENFPNLFTIGSNNGIYLTSTNYEGALADLERFKDRDEKLNVYAEILRNIVEDFPDTVVASGKTVEQIVIVHGTDIEDFIIDVFEHLTELYEQLKDVPDNWNVEGLTTYSSDIRVAETTIRTGNFVSSGRGYIYNDILSKWRKNDDYLDIIYSYYLFTEKDEEYIIDTLFEKVPLPGPLNDWYNNLVMSVQEVRWMEYYKDSEAYLADITYFMYYYKETLESAEECKNSSNALYKDLYEALNGDAIIDANIRANSYGYLYHCGSMIDSKAFINVWEKYLTLVDIYNNATLDKTKNDAEFRAALDAFLELSPAELYGFISSLNFLYDTSRGSVLILDYSENPHNMFIDMLRQYVIHVLNDACEPVFAELLLAMESFSLFDIKDSALVDFQTKMEGVIQKYNALSTADKSNFNTYLGAAYEKYLEIYNISKLTTDVNLGNLAESFEELQSVIAKYYEVQDALSNAAEDADTDGYLGLLIALYERAKDLYNDISAQGDVNALAALYAKLYTFGENEMTLDNAFFTVRSTFINRMFNLQFEIPNDEGGKDIVLAWDLYSSSNADEFFSEVVYVLYAQFNDTYPTPDKATMLDLMAKLRQLDKDSLNVFCAFEGDTFYYNMVRSFLADALSDGADEIGSKLIKAEIAYISYIFSNDASYLETFKTNIEDVKAAYDTAITETDREYVEALYNYYVEVYNNLPAAED